VSEVIAQFLEVVLAQDLRLLKIRTAGHLEDVGRIFISDLERGKKEP